MIPRKLFSPEHEAFRASFRKFLEKEVIPHHEAWEERGYVDREVWLKAGADGLLCPMMAEEHGGAGADFGYAAVIIEEIAPTPAFGHRLPAAFRHRGALHRGIRHRSAKREWLPRMANGEIITAIAMTEPGMGSDLKAMKTMRGATGRTGSSTGPRPSSPTARIAAW